PGRLLAHAALLHGSLMIVAAVSGSAAAGLGLGLYLLAHGLGLVVLTGVCHALRRDGVDDLGELAGWAAAAPRTAALSLLGGLVLLGVPGSIGFVGELGTILGILSEGDVELLQPTALGLLGAAAVGLGILGLLRSFWFASRGRDRDRLGRLAELEPREQIACIVALVLAVILGLGSGWLSTRAESAE